MESWEETHQTKSCTRGWATVCLFTFFVEQEPSSAVFHAYQHHFHVDAEREREFRRNIYGGGAHLSKMDYNFFSAVIWFPHLSFYFFKEHLIPISLHWNWSTASLNSNTSNRKKLSLAELESSRGGTKRDGSFIIIPSSSTVHYG